MNIRAVEVRARVLKGEVTVKRRALGQLTKKVHGAMSEVERAHAALRANGLHLATKNNARVGKPAERFHEYFHLHKAGEKISHQYQEASSQLNAVQSEHQGAVDKLRSLHQQIESLDQLHRAHRTREAVTKEARELEEMVDTVRVSQSEMFPQLPATPSVQQQPLASMIAASAPLGDKQPSPTPPPLPPHSSWVAGAATQVELSYTVGGKNYSIKVAEAGRSVDVSLHAQRGAPQQRLVAERESVRGALRRKGVAVRELTVGELPLSEEG